MKQFSTRISILLLSFIFLSKSGIIAQVNYEFKGATLLSGTPLSVGAVYQFSTVKPGTDATVTITNITGGISITDIDGAGGFGRALQPVLSVPPLANGYIEFKVDFFIAGTGTPEVQAEVPITPIDVDGQMYSGLPLYEFDEVQMPNGYAYYQFTGAELMMNDIGGWVRGKNIAAIDYPGIDTAQKAVMFTTVNANISTISFRVGADNQSFSTTSRLRSVYFQRFSYPFVEVLSSKAFISFSGQRRNNGVELTGILAHKKDFDRVSIEKAGASLSFSAIGEMPVSADNVTLTYFDVNAGSGTAYYRMRLFNSKTGKTEGSTVLMIKATPVQNSTEILSGFLQPANPVLRVSSGEDGEANLRVMDMSGRVLANTKIRLRAGSGTISLPPFNVARGILVIILEPQNRQAVSRKVFVQ